MGHLMGVSWDVSQECHKNAREKKRNDSTRTPNVIQQLFYHTRYNYLQIIRYLSTEEMRQLTAVGSWE